MTSPQEDLINFVTSEDALRKAAEGSMKKRSAVLYPQEDAELVQALKKYNWSGDRDFQLAVIAFREISKARDEQRQPSRAEKVNHAAELLVEWAKQENTEHLDLRHFKLWLKSSHQPPRAR